MTRRLVQVALVALCLGMSAVPSSAQVYTGRIDVSVLDSTGAVLPGVIIELTGQQSANTVTDERGEAHFLNLPPGRYVVVAKLQGFTDYRNDNVPVGAGSIVPLKVTLAVSGVAAEVEVRAETPVIETKKQTVRTNVSLDELQSIPSSRDPWVVLQTVPGIIVDRVNVGGAESGQQSNYQAKGAPGGDNTWNMDGVPITDMAALGSSPTYYDFDMFQEMQVTTGGADPSNPTAGVQLNFVLRSGTNNWRGSGRYYFLNNDLQSDNLPGSLVGTLISYNRFNRYTDYGVEGGGPVIKDKLFVWGAYGETNPRMEIYRYTGTAGATFVQSTPACKSLGTSATAAPRTYAISARDCTTLENYSAKATAEISDRVRGGFSFFRGDKIKLGRDASATRPDETAYNQTGPTDLYKGEGNFTIGNNLFVTARYAYTAGGFGFEPRGGHDTTAYKDDEGVWHNTFGFYLTDRPQKNFQIEGNHFRGSHELKFGFGWRKSAVASESGWPGGIYTVHTGYPNMEATVVRNWSDAANAVYISGFLGDTITRDRLTLNLGVRWDRAIANLQVGSVPANPLSPLLPALQGQAQDSAAVFQIVTPRIGLTYALGESRRTIARASYGAFAGQLTSARGYTVSTIPGYSYVYYSAVDLNGNNVADPNELGAFLGTYGFDPDNPLGGNPDRIGDYATPLTHEFVAGVEHELFTNFGLSGTFTYRRFVNFNWLQYRGVTGSDYVEAGRLTDTTTPVGPYDIPFYTIDSSLVPSDFGRLYEKRNGYHQRYWGLEIAATKRMSNNWMMRAGWSTNDHREYFDSLDAKAEPTSTLANPNKDGGLVMTATGGSGKSGIYMVLPKYQFILTSAYQARWGINLGLNYLFRQGYSTPYYRERTPGSADDLAPVGKSVLLVSDVGDYRLPNVHSVDARVSKSLRAGRVNANLDLDIFNVFNTSTVLGREYNLRLTTFNQVKEIMNPRVVRFGVRVGF
jgi:hypothetical protein